VRVQLLSKTLVRVENKGPKGFEDRKSYMVTNRDLWEVVNYETINSTQETVIKTSAYSVHVPNGGKAEDVYVTTPGNDKRLYTYTGKTDTNVYLPSPSEELKSWYFTDSPRIIPSESGWNNINQLNQGWDFDNDATDIFVFLPNGNYQNFTTDYVKLTGESEMVDLQTLGYWDSRWYAYSSETALQQIQDYKDRGYSIDVLVIDTDWRDASNGVGYEINTNLFPNMAEFLAECERLGVDICFNDHP
jgi:alpha-glucosidase (family GH31 glycosyl hydrolase)